MPKARKKKRTEYLSYIEDTPKHRHILVKLIEKAGSKAMAEARSNNLAITYFDGEAIVREFPDGSKETIKKMPNAFTPYVEKSASP